MATQCSSNHPPLTLSLSPSLAEMARAFVTAMLLLVATVQFVAAFKDGLLQNGNFELGPRASQMNGTKVIGSDSIPQWHTSGFIEYIRSGQKQGDMLLIVPEGSAAVRLGNEASIKQRLAVTIGTVYALTFTAVRTCAQDEQLNISAMPDADVIPMQTMYSSNGWDSYAWAWTAKSSVADIVIHNLGTTEDPACGPLIDSVAVKVLHPPTITNKNVVKNGDFEEGPYILPNTTWGVLVPPHIDDDGSPLPGWMVMSLKAVKYIDAAHFAVPHGQHAVELLGGKESVLVQEVRTVRRRLYVLSFAVGDARNACKGEMMVEAFAGRDTVKVKYESKAAGGYKRAMLRFTAVDDRTRVVFYSSYYHTRSDDLSSLCGPVIDDVAVVSIRKPRG